MDRVRETECERARELVEEISALRLEDKAPETLARYVFRGQGMRVGS
jgi:hypothetical protein